MTSKDEFDAQWRASAHEAVPYADDNPECLSVYPELTDGSIGQGNATRIETIIEFTDYDGKLKGELVVRDNGKGITNIKRLLSWASKTATSTHHRYGHGSKKCLTKWSKDYSTAVWHVKYRTCDRRGVSSSLIKYGNPYRGLETEQKEDEVDEVTLMPSGTEWYIEFDPEILGPDLQTPKALFARMKEILRTRYSKKYFDTTDFVLEVKKGYDIVRESSKEAKWKTFQECLEEEVAKGDKSIVEVLYDRSVPFHEGTMTYKRYSLSGISGQQNFDLKKEFPTYGNKNMKSSRLHIALDGRCIEIAPLWHFYSDRTSNHNGLNGHFGFVNFIPNTPGNYDTMPTPCTTKVSFYENCPYYKEFVKIISAIHEEAPKPSIPQVVIYPKPSGLTLDDLKKLEERAEKYSKQENPKNEVVTPKEPAQAYSLYQEYMKKNLPLIRVEHPEWNMKQSLEELGRQWAFEKERNKELKAEPKAKAESKKDKVSIPKKVRDDVWNTWIGKSIAQHKCLCCKKTTIDKTEFHCGHVKPEAEGGSATIDNLRPICASCNLSMGTMNMLEFIKKYEYFL